MPATRPPRVEELVGWVRDARQRTLDLIADLSDDELRVPRLPILNPLLWEIGHVAWFQEKWVLRHVAGRPPIRPDADALYDSAAVSHDSRWDLPLPTRAQTLDYLVAVRDRVVERLLAGEPRADELYFQQLAVFHEDMHGEAFLMSRQALALPAPPLCVVAAAPQQRTGSLSGDAEVPGGTFLLGTPAGRGFAFDNEQQAHEVPIEPFAIARVPVTEGEFASFVDDGGYSRPELWSEDGWRWRERRRAEHPVHFGPERGRWLVRHFDRWRLLEVDRPMVHVSWHEANAFCRWASRRLPTEAEWEAAAAGEPSRGDVLARSKRRYAWGDASPSAVLANLDGAVLDTLDTGALPASDSAFGCRQMIGNVWEWTADTFLPYPGFEPGPYEEYSAPWFGTHKVLRGGSWSTRARLVHNTWRNYYTPDRRDVFAGFRTCRIEP